MKQFKDNVKIPTGSELSNEVTFPVHLSPNWLQKLINEHSESYGTPPELWATAFLSHETDFSRFSEYLVYFPA